MLTIQSANIFLNTNNKKCSTKKKNKRCLHKQQMKLKKKPLTKMVTKKRMKRMTSSMKDWRSIMNLVMVRMKESKKKMIKMAMMIRVCK